MEITSIRIKKGNQKEGVLGVASIQLDNCLVIHGIQLVELKDKSRIISFPNKKVKRCALEDGKYTEAYSYSDIVHPSNQEFRDYLKTELYKVYENMEDSK